MVYNFRCLHLTIPSVEANEENVVHVQSHGKYVVSTVEEIERVGDSRIASYFQVDPCHRHLAIELQLHFGFE